MNWKRWLWPFLSRKVQVALAGLIVAYGADVGLNWPEERILAILGVASAVILGIAGEDAAAKRAGQTPGQ